MAIYYFNQIVNNVPEDQYFIIDTSFALSILYEEKKEAIQFHEAIYKKNTLYSTITTNHEFYNFYWKYAFIEWASKEYSDIPPNLTVYDLKERKIEDIINKSNKNGKLKNMTDYFSNPNKTFMSKIMRFNALFPYKHWDKTTKMKLEDLASVMRKYLLRSSDAMIANYCLCSKKDKEFTGLITCDWAFSRLKNDIDIFLP